MIAALAALAYSPSSKPVEDDSVARMERAVNALDERRKELLAEIVDMAKLDDDIGKVWS